MDNETDWFPAHIKPVHEGVYKTRHKLTHVNWCEGYSMYRIQPHNNSHIGWCFVENEPSQAKMCNYGTRQDKEWKGLTKP